MPPRDGIVYIAIEYLFKLTGPDLTDFLRVVEELGSVYHTSLRFLSPWR
jgi:hypothetical protein